MRPKDASPWWGVALIVWVLASFLADPPKRVSPSEILFGVPCQQREVVTP